MDLFLPAGHIEEGMIGWQFYNILFLASPHFSRVLLVYRLIRCLSKIDPKKFNQINSFIYVQAPHELSDAFRSKKIMQGFLLNDAFEMG